MRYMIDFVPDGETTEASVSASIECESLAFVPSVGDSVAVDVTNRPGVELRGNVLRRTFAYIDDLCVICVVLSESTEPRRLRTSRRSDSQSRQAAYR
jgi:hypothetical protein